ncbi:MAG: ArsA-related P-loop ATPase [Actinomycetota bacterium]
MTGIDDLLASREMVLVTGSGGVGKTTIAAALGMAAVQRQQRKVLVVTVDPARRLATALGLAGIGNTPQLVDPDAFVDAGVEVRGELHVAMLDTKAGWDELIRRHAPDHETRDAVLANPLYDNLTSRFVHSHDYLAMEQLHDFHATGAFDLVIVDTPPSRNALSILDAPGRMADFFGSRLLKWLTVPYRSRLFSAASRPFQQVADRVLGSRFLQDIADFFILFQRMERGFVQRAREVEALVSDPRTSFVVVTTLEAAPTHEARFLLEELADRRLPLGAVIANRTLPDHLADRAATDAADALTALAGDSSAAPAVAPDGGSERAIDEIAAAIDADPARVRRVIAKAADRFDDVSMVAAREADRRDELSSSVDQLVSVPWASGDIHDLGGLAAVADVLRSG